MATPATRAGKPTLLNTDMIEAISSIVAAGNYLDDAAHSVGITARTAFKWAARGRQALADADNNHDNIPDTERIYVQFVHAVEKARSEAAIRNVRVIQDATADNWQAAAWYLERTNPKKWGRRETVEITGEDGGPIRVEVSARETLAAKFAAAEQAMRNMIDATATDVDEIPQLRQAQ
jgi:hypothetical protein